jgi:outer membrane lipopolysaccharide assembly protein LptE/RlpB
MRLQSGSDFQQRRFSMLMNQQPHSRLCFAIPRLVSDSRSMRLPVIALLICLMAFSSGCGYSTAGKATHIPDNVQTIFIPAFVNQTRTYKIEQTVTAQVVREFVSRTRFKIVSDPQAESDATLKGTVVSTTVAPLTYDSQSGRASSALVTVNMKVSLVDRAGKVIFEDPNYTFREQYQVSRDIASFLDEESPALARLSRDLARTLVADVLEAY